MNNSSNDTRRAIWQLAVLALLAVSTSLATSRLGFTNRGVDVAFKRLFLLWPLLAIRPALRLHGLLRGIAWTVLIPLLVMSSFGLLALLFIDIPAAISNRELSHNLGSFSQGSYSVHLLWVETAGGALGSHGVSLQQRLFILPGVYLVKYLDYCEGATRGNIAPEGTNKVRLHIEDCGFGLPKQKIDQVYSLKPKVYF